MELPRVILVATDFSAGAQYAQRHAIKLAKNLDAGVHLLHSWQLPVFGASVEAG